MTEHSRFSGNRRALPSPPSWQARSCAIFEGMSSEESLREGARSSASSLGRDLSLGKGPRALVK
ncbi:unnamed protein product [Prunus armeniaca]